MLIHGGNYGKDVIDFSVNTNPNITKEIIEKLLCQHAETALKYPEIDALSLESFIGEKEGIETNRLAVGNGAVDCLYRVAAVLKPASAIIIEPTFSEYRRALERQGCLVNALTYRTNVSSAEQEKVFLQQLKKVKANLVVLCNPNNPTGHVYSGDFITALLKQQSEHKGYVLVDESFRGFEGFESCYTKKAWNLIVLTSLTKYYGIPGLRIGYITGNYSLIETMKQEQVPWNINGLAQSVTKGLMRDLALELKTSQWYIQEKSYMMAALESLPYMTVDASKANYFLCHLEGTTGKKLNDWLLKGSEAMAVRLCDSFPGLGNNTIRIGLKDHISNKKLVDQLKAYGGQIDE